MGLTLVDVEDGPWNMEGKLKFSRSSVEVRETWWENVGHGKIMRSPVDFRMTINHEAVFF